MSTELTPAMRRSALISLLRDRSMWPVGFEWDFRECRTCAVGLINKTFGISGSIEWQFGSNRLWEAMSCWAYLPIRDQDVTPEMVADRLEKIHGQLLAEGK